MHIALSEFVLTHTNGKNAIDWVYFADVNVTTTAGALWWKEKHCERRKITRGYMGRWRFVDTGEWCPSNQSEALERSYRAREILPDV